LSAALECGGAQPATGLDGAAAAAIHFELFKRPRRRHDATGALPRGRFHGGFQRRMPTNVDQASMTAVAIISVLFT